MRSTFDRRELLNVVGGLFVYGPALPRVTYSGFFRSSSSLLELTAQGGKTPPGGTQIVSFSITNISDSVLQSPGIQLRFFDWKIAEYTDDGGMWYDSDRFWGIESLDPGESQNPSVRFDIPSGTAEQTYDIPAEAIYDGEPVTSATANIIVGSGVDLELELTAEIIQAGNTLRIIFSLTNQGTVEATGLQGVIAPPSDSWTFANDPGSFTSLNPGETESIPAEFEIPDDASGEYTFEGWVEDDAGNRANDTVTVDIADIDLQLEITPSNATEYRTSQITVDVTLRNDGAGPASNVALGVNEHAFTVYGPLQYLEIVDHEDGRATWDGTGESGTWTWETVQPDESVETSITFYIPDDTPLEDREVIFDSYYQQPQGLLNGPKETFTVTVKSKPKFNPVQDGFGFSNFEITDAHSPGDNFDRQAIEERLRDDWEPKVDAICRGDQPWEIKDQILKAWANIASYWVSHGIASMDAWLFGHCYGLSTVAKRYYHEPSSIPVDGVETAAELSDPDQSDVHLSIDEAHRDQGQNFDRFINIARLNTGISYDLGDAVQTIKDRFDPTNPQIIGVPGHAALLFDITEEERESGEIYTTFHLYDNNFAADDSWVTSRTFQVVERDGDVAVEDPLRTRSVAGGNPDTEMNRIMALSEPVSEPKCGGLLGTLITFEVRSPARLQVYGEDGDPIQPLRPDGEPIESSFRFDFHGGKQYDIEVIGTGEGRFTLAVSGVLEQEIVVDEQRHGSIETGERISYEARVSSDGEFILNERSESGDTDDSPDTRAVGETDDDPGALAQIEPEQLAGAGAVGMGLLYLAARMLSDESE